MLETSRSSMSLRTSLLISMLLTLLPLLLSAVLGYYVLNHTVIADYRDIASRHRMQIDPLRRLQVAMLQAEHPFVEYLATGKQENLRLYRTMIGEVEADFVQLSKQLQTDDTLSKLLASTQEDWRGLEQSVTDILAFKDSGNSVRQTEAMSRFDSFQAAATNKLGTMHTLIETELAKDYQDAAFGYERSKWVAGIAGAVSLMLMAGGILMFTRNIMSSIDRLVEGVELFASGSREHVVKVQVPREMKKVAEEFNKMIKVIQVSEGKLADQARRDELTGLLNRRAFDEFMANAYARLQRHGEKVALIALDIDHFKKVNDTYGHGAGDRVLSVVARTLLESVRNIDGAFRCGGEEFSIVLPGADAAAAKITADRIRAAVEGLAVNVDNQTLKVTVSLGVALATTPAEGLPLDMQKRADTALYEAKDSGRNRVVFA